MKSHQKKSDQDSEFTNEVIWVKFESDIFDLLTNKEKMKIFFSLEHFLLMKKNPNILVF